MSAGCGYRFRYGATIGEVSGEHLKTRELGNL
jgi:hypothetical protein